MAVATRQRRLSALASLGSRASQIRLPGSSGQSFKVPRIGFADAASGLMVEHPSASSNGFAVGRQAEDLRQSKNGDLGGTGVVIRRTINAAGQPRKVAVPVGNAEGIVGQNGYMRRTVSQGGQSREYRV
jgi:hypothetical protein